MEYCLEDAKAKGKSGVCILGSKKQKSWLTDQAFAKRFGFEVVDTTDDGYASKSVPPHGLYSLVGKNSL